MEGVLQFVRRGGLGEGLDEGLERPWELLEMLDS